MHITSYLFMQGTVYSELEPHHPVGAAMAQGFLVMHTHRPISGIYLSIKELLQ
jgi:hypothetical protein